MTGNYDSWVKFSLPPILIFFFILHVIFWRDDFSCVVFVELWYQDNSGLMLFYFSEEFEKDWC